VAPREPSLADAYFALQPGAGEPTSAADPGAAATP
jgi:hypothetical protein